MQSFKKCIADLLRHIQESNNDRRQRAAARAHLAEVIRSRKITEVRLQQVRATKREMQQYRKRHGNSDALRFRMRELRLVQQIIATQLRSLGYLEGRARLIAEYFA